MNEMKQLEQRPRPSATLTHPEKSDAVQAELQIRELRSENLTELLRLAVHSNLPTLHNPTVLQRYLDSEIVFGGFLRGELISCCCIESDVRKKYRSGMGEREFPLPNLYFCGAFVLPRYRGCGIGEKMYAHRLNVVRRCRAATIIVELLGDGTPSSVHPDTQCGYRFYLRNGFQELGYSIDVDQGKIVFLELAP